MNDAVTGMCMQPVIATRVRFDTDILWNGRLLPVDIHGDMHVNVIGNLLRVIAGNAVNRCIERLRWIDHFFDLEIGDANKRE